MPRAGAAPHVVVAGGGFAGTLGAAAAVRAGADVTVVDTAGGTSEVGSLARQQLHNVVSRGQLCAEMLLPGFREALLGAGATAATVATQTHVFELGVVMPLRDLGLELWTAPKPLLIDTARRLVAELGEVRWVEDRVVGLVGDHERVTGVQLAEGGTVPADVVVDALGAASPTSTFLERLGVAPVATNVFDARHWYVSGTWRRPPDAGERPDFWLTFATDDAPGTALVSPAGPAHWKVSVSGPLGARPPRDGAEVLAHTASLGDVTVHSLLQGAELVGRLDTYVKHSSHWRRYDAADVPRGLVSIGDAVYAPNPIFGQGLSLTAWAATVLNPVLTDPDEAGSWEVTRDDVARVCRSGWDLMTVMSPRSRLHLDPPAWARVADLVRSEAGAHRRHVEMWHLLSPVDVAVELAASRPGGDA